MRTAATIKIPGAADRRDPRQSGAALSAHLPLSMPALLPEEIMDIVEVTDR
jgi:hypothetical protein